jgi:hypothetical protein
MVTECSVVCHNRDRLIILSSPCICDLKCLCVIGLTAYFTVLWTQNIVYLVFPGYNICCYISPRPVNLVEWVRSKEYEHENEQETVVEQRFGKTRSRHWMEQPWLDHFDRTTTRGNIVILPHMVLFCLSCDSLKCCIVTAFKCLWLNLLFITSISLFW